ncbi:mannose-6-phosphate isomerase, class I [Streptomyces sp. MJP52]|uniref:mannose-6-phosphate isomerase, class I n=1 Tax=Streptomyces sp. MJP52 TaxID=2940555 RepID=UPI00247538E8|nr:mannose-6-phosphate isomerase, class I [Streptomyces sp. MJP52]MDH6226638.1 mannose-6-phosphate isomerase [Streptomyces sp. MJP52]
MDLLTNTIRPYAWGSTTAIAELIGEKPTGEPQAEMWMGAHPAAPSSTPRGSLPDVIAADPDRELGARTVARFGPRLPFLLKLLAADRPLSLQVHPDLARAREGYEAEQNLGIALDAPHRNYKDANHKPELICALTDFEGLCGFRPATGTADLFEELGVPALAPHVEALRTLPEEEALRQVLTAVLTDDRETTARTVAETAAACERLGGRHEVYARIARHFPGDPGVLASMLLHHVRLSPGDALYLSAGVPHAYLRGLGVELMSTSDNVLRCGLTPKHVDVPELLRVVRFESCGADALRPRTLPDGEELYETPVDEFRLSRHRLTDGAPVVDLTRPAPQVLLCTEGGVRVGELKLAPGASVFVPAGERTEVSGSGTLFRATVSC